MREIIQNVPPNRTAMVYQVELAARMVERASGVPRAKGHTAQQCLAEVSGDDRAIWLALASCAIEYFRECLAMAAPIDG